MWVEFHFQAATSAIKQCLKWPFADVEATFFGQCVGVGEGVLCGARVPATIWNLQYRQAITWVKLGDCRRAGEPVRRIERLEQESTPAAGLGGASIFCRFGFLVFILIRHTVHHFQEVSRGFMGECDRGADDDFLVLRLAVMFTQNYRSACAIFLEVNRKYSGLRGAILSHRSLDQPVPCHRIGAELERKYG